MASRNEDFDPDDPIDVALELMRQVPVPDDLHAQLKQLERDTPDAEKPLWGRVWEVWWQLEDQNGSAKIDES